MSSNSSGRPSLNVKFLSNVLLGTDSHNARVEEKEKGRSTGSGLFSYKKLQQSRRFKASRKAAKHASDGYDSYDEEVDEAIEDARIDKDFPTGSASSGRIPFRMCSPDSGTVQVDDSQDNQTSKSLKHALGWKKNGITLARTIGAATPQAQGVALLKTIARKYKLIVRILDHPLDAHNNILPKEARVNKSNYDDYDDDSDDDQNDILPLDRFIDGPFRDIHQELQAKILLSSLAETYKINIKIVTPPSVSLHASATVRGKHLKVRKSTSARTRQRLKAKLHPPLQSKHSSATNADAKSLKGRAGRSSSSSLTRRRPAQQQFWSSAKRRKRLNQNDDTDYDNHDDDTNGHHCNEQQEQTNKANQKKKRLIKRKKRVTKKDGSSGVEYQYEYQEIDPLGNVLSSRTVGAQEAEQIQAKKKKGAEKG